LSCNANSFPRASNTTFQDVVDVKLLADGGDPLPGILVMHGGSPGNHAEAIGADTSQLGNDFFGETIAEIVLSDNPSPPSRVSS
jgi:hypothetical protein